MDRSRNFGSRNLPNQLMPFNPKPLQVCALTSSKRGSRWFVLVERGFPPQVGFAMSSQQWR
jgi:hypothetical protein